MTSCKVNQIFLGEISSVQNYGAFVRIPGCKEQGLVHRSQISSAPVDDVNEVLERGERVWCKIIAIGEDGKIGLSMKHVNQGNGKDLDPNSVQLQLDEQRRKKINYREEKKAIVLDAVYKTTCTKCKTRGHLAKDCFTTPDGKKYELIPEDDVPIFALKSQVETTSESKSNEKKPKTKKFKKKKKNKSSKQEDSDNEDSDFSKEKSKKKRKKSKSSKQEDSGSEDSDTDEKNKKRRKKSKDQKRKKKKHLNTSNDSDSDSVSSCENKKRSKKCKHSRIRHSD